MLVGRTLKREARVALSRRAQPLWFRILKWAVVIGACAILWRSPYFWLWILGGVALGIAVHLIWRWKTKGWTKPWGGWDDVETAGASTMTRSSSDVKRARDRARENRAAASAKTRRGPSDA